MRIPKLPPGWANVPALLAVALTLPLLWNTCGMDQSWGGDYAGYLSQAREIARGHTNIQPFYLYNPGVPFLAPPVYPPGFSLLTALFIRDGIPDISFFIRLNTVIWWLLGLGLFRMWTRTSSVWAAAGAAIFFLLHPIYLIEKNGILPDVLFTLLSWAAIYIYVYRADDHWKKAVLCGLLAGLAWLTRANGVVLVLALAAHQLPGALTWLRKPGERAERLKGLRFAGIAILAALLLYFPLRILFQSPVAGGSYFDQVQTALTETVADNVALNGEECIKNVRNFFQLGLPTAQIHRQDHPDTAAGLGGCLALGLIMIGMFTKGARREGLIGLFVAGTLALVLIWPMVQGYRYLLPVFPGLILYLLRAMSSVKPADRFARIAFWLLIPLLLYGEYGRAYSAIVEQRQQRDPGAPEHPTNQEAYRYVREHLPDTSIVAYHHPLILGLYAERKSMRWRPNSPEGMQQELHDFRAGYLLVNNWISQSDPALEEYLRFYKSSLDTVWHNERNCLYRIGVRR